MSGMYVDKIGVRAIYILVPGVLFESTRTSFFSDAKISWSQGRIPCTSVTNLFLYIMVHFSVSFDKFLCPCYGAGSHSCASINLWMILHSPQMIFAHHVKPFLVQFDNKLKWYVCIRAQSFINLPSMNIFHLSFTYLLSANSISLYRSSFMEKY